MGFVKAIDFSFEYAAFEEEATVNSDDVGFHGVNAGIGGTYLAFGFGEANLHALIEVFEVDLEIVDVVADLFLAGFKGGDVLLHVGNIILEPSDILLHLRYLLINASKAYAHLCGECGDGVGELVELLWGSFVYGWFPY